MTLLNDENLIISWNDYHLAIERLASIIYESGWSFDQILCLARGGLRPGDVLSRIFKVPLAIMAVNSYRDQGGTIQGELKIAGQITMTGNSLSGKVLLVDDLVDSGDTLENVQRCLKKAYPEVSEVKTAVIWYKACSSIKPDYFYQYLLNNPWICQPFEQYDNLQPHQFGSSNRVS